MATAAEHEDNDARLRGQISCSFARPSIGDYDKRIGVVTRPIAAHIISSLDLPSDAQILDNACGTGAVTVAFLEAHPDGHVTATDVSPNMIKGLTAVIGQESLEAQIDTQVIDSQALELADSMFDAAIMHTAIWFLPSPALGIAEMYRVLKPRCPVVVTTWKDTPVGPMFRAVQEAVAPQRAQGDSHMFRKWAEAETLISLLEEAGFVDVRIDVYTHIQQCRNLHKLADALAGNMHVLASDWSEDERAGINTATHRILQKRGDEFNIAEQDGKVSIPWLVNIARGVKP